MKKRIKMLLTALMAAMFVFIAAACGDDNQGGGNNGGNNGGNTGDGITATIDFNTSVNIIEQRALQTVANAYSDLQYEKGNDITIIVNNNTDPDAYTTNMRNSVSNGVSNPTIAQVSVIPEYFGTNKILNLAGYLEEPNSYIPGNTAWMDALEEDAYRTQVVGSSSVIPGLSYTSDYITVFYNKQAVLDVLAGDAAVSADGTIDQSKVTWQWLLNSLDAAKSASGKNFKNPLGISTSAQSCGEDSFNIVSRMINMYLDQYYRDFIDEVHSKPGDFSYIESVDSVWEYDQADQSADLSSKYTYNINRVVDAFFNQTGYDPTSERYTEVMQNLYELLRYADQEAAYGDIFNRFNETTIVYEEKGGSYSDMKLFYVETLTYVRTYRDAFKTTVNGTTVYPSGETITDELGWFLLPAMESSLADVADNVRASGGPNENFGVISTGQQAKDEIAVDFLRYLYSPLGQTGIHTVYKSENNAPIVSRQLVKNVNIPDEIDYTDIVNPKGNCDSSPYVIFAKGSGMNTVKIGETGTYVKNSVGAAISEYFRGSSKEWGETAAAVRSAIRGGFSNYASDKNFIYVDYTRVAELTNNLVNSPYSISA